MSRWRRSTAIRPTHSCGRTRGSRTFGIAWGCNKPLPPALSRYAVTPPPSLASPMPLRLSEHLEHDRPRERFWAVGPGALTAQELLAILLGTGTRGQDALAVAGEILSRGDGPLRRVGPPPPGGEGPASRVGGRPGPPGGGGVGMGGPRRAGNT